jgi:hypothetical protein
LEYYRDSTSTSDSSSTASSDDGQPISFEKQFVKKSTEGKSLLATTIQEECAEQHTTPNWYADPGSVYTNPEEEWNLPIQRPVVLRTAPTPTPAAAAVASPSLYSRHSSGESFPFRRQPPLRPGTPYPVHLQLPAATASTKEVSWLSSPTLTRVAHPAAIRLRPPPEQQHQQTQTAAASTPIPDFPASPDVLAPPNPTVPAPRQTAIQWQTPSPEAASNADDEGEGPRTKRVRLRTARQIREGVTASWDAGRRSPREAGPPPPLRGHRTLKEKLKVCFRLGKT